MNRFHTAAIALIAFNLVGTVLTWTVHLAKPGTSDMHAVGQGTQFTGPLFFIAAWCVFAAMSYARGRVAVVGTVLMSLAALGFAFGEVSELVQHNVGVSDAKWSFILGASVVGAVLGVATAATGARSLLARRRERAIAA